MAFVLDASITACWAFQDEDHPDASLAFVRMATEEAVVPSLWWFEVRNILIVNERRRRIAEPESLAATNPRGPGSGRKRDSAPCTGPSAVGIRRRSSGTGAAGKFASCDA